MLTNYRLFVILFSSFILKSGVESLGFCRNHELNQWAGNMSVIAFLMEVEMMLCDSINAVSLLVQMKAQETTKHYW